MTRAGIAAAVLVVAGVAIYMVNDARRTAALGACIQRGVDHYQAAGTYPVTEDGTNANQSAARTCEEDVDAFRE